MILSFGCWVQESGMSNCMGNSNTVILNNYNQGLVFGYRNVYSGEMRDDLGGVLM